MQRVVEVRVEDVRRRQAFWQHRRKAHADRRGFTTHTLDSRRRAQIVHLNDVTERLRVERDLRASEARYRALTELSSDWYWNRTKTCASADCRSRRRPQDVIWRVFLAIRGATRLGSSGMSRSLRR